jgi:HlyD family secretion protein
VTEIGNSPFRRRSSSAQATNFKVVVVLDESADVRPGFTCTADITTATRQSVAAVPIPSVAVRELTYDANGQVIKAPTDSKRRRRGGSNDSALDPVASAAELKPGETRKETEGVFVVRDKSKNVEFVPIKLGIAGDKYFEILSGLAPGDQVIKGPYNPSQHRRRIREVDNKQAQSK